MAAETRNIYNCTNSFEVDSVVASLTTRSDGLTVALSDLNSAYSDCLSVVTSTGGDFYLSLTNEDSGCSLYPFKAVPVVCMIGLSGGEQFLLSNIDTAS